MRRETLAMRREVGKSESREVRKFGLVATLTSARVLLFYFLLFAFYFSSCQKIEYTTMDNPAYLRVFNSLNQLDIMDNKGDTLSYLCMLINPEFDADGIPIGAEIVGDFLDVRDRYAPPYPSHIGVSTTVNNPEYPGKESVLAAPVLNGFDLSSWAQVPSGELRFLFLYRPKNDVPFFALDNRFKRDVLADSTFNLEAGEVYTMQTLLKNFVTREKGLLLRRENFHEQAFSDSAVYVNLYNYSAEGFYEAERKFKLPASKNMENLFELGIRDTMNVFMTLFEGQQFSVYQDGIILQNQRNATPNYVGKYMFSLQRGGYGGTVSPYFGFPMWVNDRQNGIATELWQRFYFLAPAMELDQNRFDEYGGFYTSHLGGIMGDTDGNFAAINFILNGPKLYYPEAECGNCAMHSYHAGVNFPNLVVSTHSGEYNPRSFGTVNTIEIINGQVYLMTIQRRYAPPAY